MQYDNISNISADNNTFGDPRAIQCQLKFPLRNRRQFNSAGSQRAMRADRIWTETVTSNTKFQASEVQCYSTKFVKLNYKYKRRFLFHISFSDGCNEIL